MSPAPVCDLPGLLVLLPYHVGFHPMRSVVVVALDGVRLDLVERVDLPAAGEVLDEVTTARMVGALRRRRMSTALVIGYGADHDPWPVLRNLAGAMASVACDIRVIVVGDGWWSERPGVLRSLPLPADVAAVAEFVGRGVAPFADRGSLAEALLPHGPDLTAAVTSRGRPGRGEGFAAWERLLLGHERDDDLVLALTMLGDVRDRDALLVRLVPMTDGPADDGSWGIGPFHPTEGRARVRALLIRVARAAPVGLRAAALSVLAVWAWSVGDGATAAIAADLALRADPHYALARIVAQLVGHDVHPPAA